MTQLDYFQNEKGIALVIVMFVSAMLLIAMGAGYSIMTSANRTAITEITRDEVLNVGLAGVEDALSWFRSTQYGKPPVKITFDPKLEAPNGTVCSVTNNFCRGTIAVELGETQDNTIGIMRDFKIAAKDIGLYGHYEVKTTKVQDITQQRLPSSGSSGLVWNVEVDAEVYKACVVGDLTSYQWDPTTGKYVLQPSRCTSSLPNSVSDPSKKKLVLTNLTIGAEFRRMALNPPPAILSTYRASNIRVHQFGEVRNDTGSAIYVAQNTGNVTNNGIWVGFPQQTSVTDTQFSTAVDPLTVMGMTLPEFKTYVQNNPNGIYINNNTDFNSKLVPYPSGTWMVYIEGGAGFSNATINLFSGTTRLNGQGVIIADGINLDILGGPSGCTNNDCGNFLGLVYASGTLRIDNGAVITGAIVSTQKNQGAGGSQSIQVGSSNPGSPLTRLIYNGVFITTTLNQLLGNYSISKTPTVLR
jgi:hypothetical protein